MMAAMVTGATTMADIVGTGADASAVCSSEMLEKVIRELEREKRKVKRREQKELERQEVAVRKERERRESHAAKVTSMDLPLDWENAFRGDVRADGVHAETVFDGLIYSLGNLGMVDIEYISEITGIACGDVISTLKGSIFQNPET